MHRWEGAGQDGYRRKSKSSDTVDWWWFVKGIFERWAQWCIPYFRTKLLTRIGLRYPTRAVIILGGKHHHWVQTYGKNSQRYSLFLLLILTQFKRPLLGRVKQEQKLGPPNGPLLILLRIRLTIKARWDTIELELERVFRTGMWVLQSSIVGAWAGSVASTHEHEYECWHSAVLSLHDVWSAHDILFIRTGWLWWYRWRIEAPASPWAYGRGCA